MSETKLPPLDVTHGLKIPDDLVDAYDEIGRHDSISEKGWRAYSNGLIERIAKREEELTAALEREEKLKEMNRELAEVNTELQKLVDEACTAGENTEAKFAALQKAAREYLVGGDADLAIALRGLLEEK